MKNIYTATFSAFLLAGTAIASSPTSARPMTAEDLATLKRVGAPAVSADERWTAFSVTETDPESYERATALYLLDLTKANAAPVRIADQVKASEHDPAFSPDSKTLYYLSDASGSEQLWNVNISLDGKAGTPVQASDLKTDIAGFKLSPAGGKIAVWGDIAKNCPTFGCDEENSGDGNRAEPGPGTGRAYTDDDRS